jgi:hypothetical protein
LLQMSRDAMLACSNSKDDGEGKVKTLDVQAKLEYARSAVAVLRALQITGKTMRYGEFAQAIGEIRELR